MENKAQDYFESRPQRLCHMCGKCCRVVTTAASYEELTLAASENQEGAKEFLRVFEPYSSIEDARLASKETVDNIIDSLKEDESYDENNLTFYKCRYLLDNNLCSIYENRPELCDRFPSSEWAVIPPQCGFEGWLFQKREEKKQHVRKLKENILSFEIMLKDNNDAETVQKIQDAIRKINEIIEHYAKYGSKDW